MAIATYTIKILIKEDSKTAVDNGNGDVITIESCLKSDPFIVPVDTSWHSLPFGSVSSGQFAYLSTNRDILLKLNDHTNTIKVTDYFMLKGGITAAQVKNLSGSAAEVTFLIAEET